MDIKKELEKIEEVSNGQIILDDFGENKFDIFASIIISVNDKNGNNRTVTKSIRIDKNTKKIVVYPNKTDDSNNSKVLETVYEKSLLETLQKEIIPIIENTLK